MKSPMDLDIGDIIHILNGKKWAKIINVRQWFQYYVDTIGPLATISNRKIVDLDSGENFIFFVESVEILRNIDVMLKYKSTQMQGARGEGTITIFENGLGDPYMLNKFCYNEPWYAVITENLGLTLTDERLMLFKGIELTLDKLSETEAKEAEKNKTFTEVSG